MLPHCCRPNRDGVVWWRSSDAVRYWIFQRGIESTFLHPGISSSSATHAHISFGAIWPMSPSVFSGHIITDVTAQLGGTHPCLHTALQGQQPSLPRGIERNCSSHLHQVVLPDTQTSLTQRQIQSSNVWLPMDTEVNTIPGAEMPRSICPLHILPRPTLLSVNGPSGPVMLWHWVILMPEKAGKPRIFPNAPGHAAFCAGNKCPFPFLFFLSFFLSSFY